MFAISSLALLMAMSAASAYPMQDTDFLRSAYCFHLSLAPRLSVDLSNSEKKDGQEKFFQSLIDNKLEFPRGKDYDDIKYQFYLWAMGKFGKDPSDNKGLIEWYQSNCVKHGAGGGA